LNPFFVNSLGLRLEGADWVSSQLSLSTGTSTKLPASALVWTRRDPATIPPTDGSMVTLPVYLNSDRSDILFTLDLAAKKSDSSRFYQRGVALLAFTLRTA
jgi:dynein heavy chain 1